MARDISAPLEPGSTEDRVKIPDLSAQKVMLV